jgi:hypothetical protein
MHHKGGFKRTGMPPKREKISPERGQEGALNFPTSLNMGRALRLGRRYWRLNIMSKQCAAAVI